PRLSFHEHRLSTWHGWLEAPVRWPRAEGAPFAKGTLLVQIDARRAFLRRQMQTQSAVAAFLGWMLALALIGWAMFRIGVQRRLGQILKATQAIASGDLAARSGVFGQDEVGQLGRAVDAMAARLQRQRRRLAEAGHALAAMREGVIIASPRGRIRWVNPALVRILGMRSAEIIGRSLQRIRLQQGTMGDRLVRAKKGLEEETGLIGAQGVIVPVRLSIAPIRVEGKLHGFVIVVEDRRERAALENKLMEAQKMEAVGTLVGGIAHDFNNMLAGVSGNLFLLKRRLAEADRELVDRIESLIRRSAEMIKQLLAFVRRDSGGQMNPMDLVPFLKEAMRTTRVIVPETVAMEIELPSEPVRVFADPTQLQQMLMNLIANARDALESTPDPKIRVRLRVCSAEEAFGAPRPEYEAQRWACLEVEDNGPGIPEEARTRIFDPFFTTKPVGKGTGLGLAMVYGAMRRHGGEVLVGESELGGACFRLLFPITDKPVREDTVDRIRTQELQGTGAAVLVADDEPGVRTVLGKILAEMGYRPALCATGREAWQRFRDEPESWAAAVLDVVMPEMSGPEAAREMRRVREDFPIIFITGYDPQQTLDEWKRAPNLRVLFKPVDVHALLQALHEMSAHR
ncbi:MAG: hybrid sensor histidine kinase/response regulator, partial [Zetaproteobacteria bacterium]